MNAFPRDSSVTIIGLGLIGASLGLALRRAGVRARGMDRSPAARRAALRCGAVAAADGSPAAACRGAGMVVLCIPVQAVDGCLRRLVPHLRRGAVVTDACSVKAPVVAAARRRLPDPARFVGGHPMAGSERSGAAAASASLFRGRTVVLTPVRGTSPAALRAVESLWRMAGARMLRLTPSRHDDLVARVSHLPHALAAALTLSALRPAGAARVAAGSFRGATRVAASSPALWEGILFANRRPLATAAGELGRALAAVVGAARRGDRGALRALLARAARMRRRLGETGC